MKYLLKLWLTTLLIPPFIVCCILALAGDKNWINGGTILLLLSLMVFTGLFMSVPAMALLFLLKTYLEKNGNPTFIKAIITAFSVTAIYLIFLIADYSFVFSLNNNIWWPVVYCATATAAIYYFKISPDKGKTQTNEQPRINS